MERITRRMIRFDQAFATVGSLHNHPPGLYEVELVEEEMGLSVEAYRLVSAAVLIASPKTPGTVQMLPVAPGLVREAELAMEAGAAV